MQGSEEEDEETTEESVNNVKWRVVMIGCGVLMMSIMARLEWSTPQILLGWLLGYITFPTLWGYLDLNEKKKEKEE